MDRAKTKIEAANDAMIHPQAWQEMSLSAFCNEKEAAALNRPLKNSCLDACRGT